MISIYHTQFLSPLENQRFLSLLEVMPNEIKNRIFNFRKWEDAHACLLGRCLLNHAFVRNNSNVSVADLQYTSFGRPYCGTLNDFDFNISHSGNIVVCAVTNKGKIGIDLEERKQINTTDFKNQFLKREWENIKDEAYPHYTFYDYWTKKEAVLKADGRGFFVPFDSVDVSAAGKIIVENQAWFSMKIDAFANYACNLSFDVMQGDFCLHALDFSK